ncbi:MAG: hypothetical protein RI994_2170 [Pseudomonadota bacterium]
MARVFNDVQCWRSVVLGDGVKVINGPVKGI